MNHSEPTAPEFRRDVQEAFANYCRLHDPDTLNLAALANRLYAILGNGTYTGTTPDFGNVRAHFGRLLAALPGREQQRFLTTAALKPAGRFLLTNGTEQSPGQSTPAR